MSLNAEATLAALEPDPLVTTCRNLTVANVDSNLSCQAAARADASAALGGGRLASVHMCLMITLAR